MICIQVVIEHGELMCGILSKTTLGNRSGSLMHIVAMECDRDIVKSFYDNIQTVVNNFLLLEGHSIGIEDAIADQVTYRDIQDTIAQAKVCNIINFRCINQTNLWLIQFAIFCDEIP